MNIKLSKKMPEKQMTTFQIGDVRVGEDFLIIAGPCSIESREQILRIAQEVKAAGANMLRGGAYKPRTSPYSFQGLGRAGLQYLKDAGEEVGLPIVSEVVDTRDVYLVCDYVDMLQVGARNMQNYSLLKEVGQAGKPVLLKRGMYANIEEWLNCAEYILCEGNESVLLCERGLRTTETFTRNTLDLSAVAAVRKLSHLPVITDPSHGTGIPFMIPPMCMASISAGAQGIMIEVHDCPNEALSDGDQAVSPEDFAGIVKSAKKLWSFVTKENIS